MTRSVELYVRDVVKDRNGETVVVVVPNNRLSLMKGDRFVLCYGLSADEVINAVPNPTRLNKASVDLTVAKIDVGRERLINELPAGHTAGIYFSGTGLSLVGKGSFLRMPED